MAQEKKSSDAAEEVKKPPEKPMPAPRAASKQTAEYSVEELAAAAAAVFGIGTSPDSVIAAFRVAGKTSATKSEAKQIVESFRKKEVK